MKSDFSPSRRTWNVIMTAVVWAAAVLVIALTVGVIGLVLVRGIPHISWEFLSTTASVSFVNSMTSMSFRLEAYSVR